MSDANALLRQALALLTATNQGDREALLALLSDFGRYRAEAARRMADMPPEAQAQVGQVLAALQSSTGELVDAFKGLVALGDVLVGELANATGRTKAEWLQELALRYSG